MGTSLNPPQPGPGWTSDALVQALLTEMQNACNQMNGFALQNYHFLLQQWAANNARGVFNPAPPSTKIAVVNQAATIATEVSGADPSLDIQYVDYWEVAPGTIAQAPATPVAPPQPANPFGSAVPFVPNMRQVAQGDAHAIGDTVTDPTDGSHWIKIAEGPMGGALWLKQ